MKLEQSFEVTATTHEIETRIAAFMQRNGYHPEAASKTSFTRGSWLGSLFAFSPRKWRVRARVTQQQLASNHWSLKLALDINDKGQIVTQHERLYWKTELDQFQTAVQTGETAAELLTRQDRAAARSGLTAFIAFLGTGLLVGLPVTLGISLVNPQTGYLAIIIGTLCGFAAGLFAVRWYWRP
ncbi:MAG: hypothetical protein HOP19_01715 [Acidobacteria bacterium]|nr:hypothetical protein [Acidobacteriota bacterium]